MNRTLLILAASLASVILLLAALKIFRGYSTTGFVDQAPEHGVAFTIEADWSNGDAGTNGLLQLKTAVGRRASRLGAAIYWEPISESRIRVVTTRTNLPGGGSVENALFRRGLLEFRLVHPAGDQFVELAQIPSGYQILKLRRTGVGNLRPLESLVVKQESEPGLNGPLIKDAIVVRDQTGRPQINFRLTPAAVVAFARVTRENVGRRLAIILDGELYSAPVIMTAIETGNCQITGEFEPPEAMELAAMLESPLLFLVKVIEVKTF